MSASASTYGTEAQREITAAAAAFLERRLTREVVRAVVDAGSGHDRALWREIAALGWCGLCVPEDQGGLGLGLQELAGLAELLGGRLAPVPFLETAGLAASLLSMSGISGGPWLQRLAEDAPVIALSFQVGTARREAEAWVLDGQWQAVVAAAQASMLLLPARTAEGLALFAVETGFDEHGSNDVAVSAPLKVTPRRSIDLTQSLGDVQATALRLPAAACLAVGPAVDTALARARQVGAVVLAAEQVGLAEAALAASVAYTGQRVQFGRPVAAFQAVKHRCAQMMVAVESARSAVQAAAQQLDAFKSGAAGSDPFAGGDAARVAAQARVLATEAALFCTREALQLHGGAGYTWEVDIHLMLRRAQAAAQRFGAVGPWLDEVACRLLEGDRPPGPSDAGTAEASAGAAQIRRDIRSWLTETLQGSFAGLKGLRGPGEPGFNAAQARAWEQALAAGGWTALGWPCEHGGRGWSLAEQVAFHEEYASVGGPGRLGHIGEQLLAPTLLMHGTPEQQARFLPPIREGREFWAQGYSEPGAGSDLAAVRTRARLEDSQWIIDGQKVWTSWAHLSDWIFVLARTEPGSHRHQGLTLLLVPLRQPGIEVRPIRQITGHAEFNEVFFDGVRTEAWLHLGPVGQGWRVAMDLLQVERGVSTLGQQAHFRQELDALLAVAQRNGAAQDPVLRRRLARAALGLDTLRCNALRVLAQDAEAQASGKTEATSSMPAGGGQTAPQRVAFIAKYVWSNWRRDLGELAMDVLGVQGLVDRGDEDVARLQRLWLESRADTIYAGTNEIQLNLIAERALGMPR
jgi:alkylation response protein AidB-like acyl-CoA dehydrogenase